MYGSVTAGGTGDVGRGEGPVGRWSYDRRDSIKGDRKRGEALIESAAAVRAGNDACA